LNIEKLTQLVLRIGKYKNTLIFFGVIFHIIFFIIFYPTSQISTAGIFILTPLFLTGWYYGKNIGALAGLTGVIKTYFVAFLIGIMDFDTFFYIIFLVNIIFLTIIGYVIGYMSDTRKKLQNEVILRKKSENLLIEQKKELSDFNRVMAHDLRNFLSVISTYSDVLKEEYDSEYLNKIQSNVTSINDLLSKSLILAESGLIVEAKEKANLNVIIERTLDSLNLNGIEIEKEPLPIVMGDRQKIYQIFKNLLENAKIHGKPSKIDIKCFNGDDRYKIEISNDGIPINSSTKDLFNKKRSYNKTKGRLGLYLVKKLTKAHGWSIFVDTKPNTTFILEIPVIGN
jgi:signal transduction histidine kinase